MKNIEIGNRCRVIGEGEPIIFVHGMGGPAVLEPASHVLKKYYRLIIPTLPGFTESDGIIDYSDKLYIDFIEDIRKTFSLDKINLIGISMGGRTVTNYAIQYPQNVSNLTVIDGVGVGYMLPLLAVPFLGKIVRNALYRLLSNSKSLEGLARRDFKYHNSQVFTDTTNKFIELMQSDTIRRNWTNIFIKIAAKNKNWDHQLRNLNIPALILWGEEDGTAPVKWGRELHRLIPNSTLHILEGYKHMALAEQPQFFVDKVTEFLNNG